MGEIPLAEVIREGEFDIALLDRLAAGDEVTAVFHTPASEGTHYYYPSAGRVPIPSHYSHPARTFAVRGHLTEGVGGDLSVDDGYCVRWADGRRSSILVTLVLHSNPPVRLPAVMGLAPYEPLSATQARLDLSAFRSYMDHPLYKPGPASDVIKGIAPETS